MKSKPPSRHFVLCILGPPGGSRALFLILFFSLSLSLSFFLTLTLTLVLSLSLFHREEPVLGALALGRASAESVRSHSLRTRAVSWAHGGRCATTGCSLCRSGVTVEPQHQRPPRRRRHRHPLTRSIREVVAEMIVYIVASRSCGNQ